MKTRTPIHLLLCMFLFSGQIAAQTYFFSVESADYEPIQGGQDVVSDVWNDPYLTLPIGFEFEFFTKTITEITLPSFFSIISLLDEDQSNVASVFILLGADLADRGLLEGTHLSPIKTAVTGSAGARVFTLEFQNAGFYFDLFINGTSTDFINLQMKLYEASGDIVFHFGPRSVTMPLLAYIGYDGPIIGIAEDFDIQQDVVNGEIILLSGDPLDPDLNNDYGEYTLGSTIPENTLYRFSREDVSAVPAVMESQEPHYYPNPARGIIHLKEAFMDDVLSPVDIYSIDGRFVKRFEETTTCDLHDISAGWYQLRFESKDGIHAEKLIVLPD